jgi:hypothetical protein
MRVLVILILIALTGCNSESKKREQKLKDTLQKLSLKADFRPLGKAEAYRFMNEYYLPRLDSLPTKRKIALNPLPGIDFKLSFKRSKRELEDTIMRDSSYIKSHPYQLYPPDGFIPDKTHEWDKRLLKAMIVVDTSRIKDVYDATEFHKKYGFGYMRVSYPQYNANTRRLIIREWLENGPGCGNGRDNEFHYTKTDKGWKID